MHKIFHAQNRKSGIVEAKGNGYLYNWYAVKDDNFAPTDWASPETSDFITLSNAFGGDSSSGAHLKETGFEHWNSPNNGATNASGFTAYGSGVRNTAGPFVNIKNIGHYVSKTLNNAVNWYMIIYYNTINTLHQERGLKDAGSVRLLYTGTGTPTTVTDYDGNIYDVVLIGSQYWTLQNWKCTHLNNGTLIPKIEDPTTWSNTYSMAMCSYNNDENNV